MSEFGLLEKNKQLEYELHILNIKESFTKEEPKRILLNNEIKEMEEKIDDLRNVLSIPSNNKEVGNVKDAIIRQINNYIKELKAAPLQINVSKSQGYCLENYLVTKIVMDITRFVEGRPLNASIPYLEFTTNKEDSIENEVLINFLTQEIMTINSISSLSHILLLDFVEQFVSRLVEAIY